MTLSHRIKNGVQSLLICSDMGVVTATGGCADRIAGIGQQSDPRRMDIF